MNRWLLAVAALLGLFPASAMAGGLIVDFVPPVYYTDGARIDKPITFVLFGAPEGQSMVEVARSVTRQIAVASLPRGRWCGQVHAMIDNVWSDGAPVPPFCVAIDAPAPAPTRKKPGPVTGVTHTVTP
jgi:hypothetical protein